MLAEAAAAGVAALALWSGWIEPRSLRIRRHRCALPGLTAPLRAVAIGDIQAWRHHWPERRLRAAFARAQAEGPDIVFWLGDYFDAPTGAVRRWLRGRPRLAAGFDRLKTPMRQIADAMGTLSAPMGAYAVLGNHDWAWSGAEVAAHLRRAGIRPLIGEAVVAVHPVGGTRLSVVGLDDASSGRPPGWARIGPGAAPPVVALTHAPDLWPQLAPRPALTLAGHSHGGQVAPFGRRRPPRLPQGARAHPYGWYGGDGGRLYVTAGIGASPPPVRMNAPPEIVVIDLLPAPLSRDPDGPERFRSPEKAL